jgi:hypothetical protein
MICSSVNLQRGDFSLVWLAVKFILIQLYQQQVKVHYFFSFSSSFFVF